jgi:hypothetical protein
MNTVSTSRAPFLGIAIVPVTYLRRVGARFESSAAFRDILATHMVVNGR